MVSSTHQSHSWMFLRLCVTGLEDIIFINELHFFSKILSFNNCSLFGTNCTNENDSFINSMFK